MLGLSQGALLARYIVESCPIKGKVRQWASIGGPNMGVAQIPHCTGTGPVCGFINGITQDLVYTSLIQNTVGPAGYFRDSKNYYWYLEASGMLVHLNNEIANEEGFDERKQRFSALNGALLVKFTEDTMIIPKESAWFWEID